MLRVKDIENAFIEGRSEMRAAAIGDNCIDWYEKIDGKTVNRKYPTGNVVDTGVNLEKLGIHTSIISTTGDDENGKWMVETLKSAGLDLSHLKVGKGATAVTYMELKGNDRIHGEYEEGVLEHIVFDEEDIRFAAEHDLVHSAFWGKAEKVLPAIKAKEAPLISFDYADKLEDPLIEETLACVDIGFFSYHEERDAFIEKYLQDKVSRGMKTAVATFGEKGSLAFDGKSFTQYGIVPAEKVVNTVGAGDSFIAGFLSGYLQNLSIEECLAKGAEVASKVVQVFEPWES